MALNEGTQVTDVWSDPSWLRATASGRGRLARQAQERIRDMQVEAGRQQNAAQFGAAHAQQLREFQDRQEQVAKQFQESRADREQRAQQLEAYRQSEAGTRASDAATRAQAATERERDRVVSMMPYIDVKDRPAVIKQFLANKGIPTTVTPDATTAAAQRAAGKLGQPVAQPQGAPAAAQPTGAPTTAATAPATAPLPTGASTPLGTPSAASTGGGAPTAGGAPSAPTSADLFAQGKETSLAAGKPYVEGGQVFGGPKGQDYNVSTGEWMPSGLQGTINGVPAGQAIAAGAVKTGISPESRTGMAALGQMNQPAPPPAFATSTGVKGPEQYPAPIGPPTEPFAPSIGLTKPQPGGAPTPAGDVSIGFGGHNLPIAKLGFGGGMSNEAQDVGQATAMGQPLAPNVALPPAVPNPADEARKRVAQQPQTPSQ